MIGDNKETKEEPLVWSVRLWERDPRKRWGVLLFSLAGALLGLALFHHVAFAIIAFVAIAGSSSEYIFPLNYRVDENVARVRCGISVTEVEWSKVKRVIEGPDGVKLSPLAADSRLAPFRGVYLRYSDNREAVKVYIDRFGGEGARLLEQRTDG